MATPPFRVKAVYDYSSPHDDDLSFPSGQIITVTDEEDADWYFGEYSDGSGDKQQGLFPRNFVERYEPATPPRPTRPVRQKKDTEVAAAADDSVKVPNREVQAPPEPQAVSSSPPAQATKIEDSAAKVRSDQTTSTTKSLNRSDTATSTTTAKPTADPVTSSLSKQGSPPVAEKPAIGSFRDRIAAFNKPAAPPVAPMKPAALGQSGGSSFIKKAYVAPPPSRNAYVPIPRDPPPQKVYRREEDPDVAEQVSQNAEMASTVMNAQPATSTDNPEEDQPKPTSLKERIALLQKQQLEQANRHADAAQKKEKPKRPPKKRMDSHQSLGLTGDLGESEDSERRHNEDIPISDPGESGRDVTRAQPQSPSRRQSKSRDPVSAIAMNREYLHDPNDADQSGAGETEDATDMSTEKEESDEKSRPRAQIDLPARSDPPARELDSGEEEDERVEGEEIDEEEEEEIDPEVRRKMEIRERMAKMSGGMGMAGMFGPPGGMPMMGSKKVKTSGSSPKERVHEKIDGSMDSASAHPQAVMAMPGMQRVRSPEQTEIQKGAEREEGTHPIISGQSRATEEVRDLEGNTHHTAEQPARQPTIAGPVAPVSQGRAVPPLPPIPRAAPPVPYERTGPPPLPPGPRPVQPPPADTFISPSPGSESDDEMPPEQETLSLNTDLPPNAQSINRDVPPIPSREGTIQTRPRGPRSPTSQRSERPIDLLSNTTSPVSSTAPSSTPNRSSRVPPIPVNIPLMASPLQTRAPPPPPPQNQASTSTKQTDENNMYRAAPNSQVQDESEEEVSEYDGDYDTDMASSVAHKNALKSHTHTSSTDDTLTGDEAAYHHQGLPSLGLPPGPPPIPVTAPPRAVPPPPPNQPPKHIRQSSEIPRAAPPPPPPPSKEYPYEEDDGEYNSYNYEASGQNTSTSAGTRNRETGETIRVEEQYDESYKPTPPQQYPGSPASQGSTSFQTSPIMPPMPRQSLDVLRTTTSRRSMENARSSMEQGFIAEDVDLGRTSQWWLQRKMPPPVFQARTDVSFEMDESSATQHGGGQSTIKHVYVLFKDYSQTIITARFDVKDPSKVEFQQRHEAPPLGLRQDQLEDAHSRLGARIAEMANTKLNQAVGDGSPFALVNELMNALPAALPPVGIRAFGALVYNNLANASVQQHDEIRAGDIISFRNAKLQGHRGSMKQKYHIEVGKPDHVAIVVDWDGTKKKVRAWEQGRESKKVKVESIKLGDLRSGEVKVWRVMAREWVGWGGKHI